MKSAQELADQFCNHHIVNTRNNVMKEFIEMVQNDARKEFIEYKNCYELKDVDLLNVINLLQTKNVHSVQRTKNNNYDVIIEMEKE